MTFSLWTDEFGQLLVDDSGAPLWCDVCPCDPGTVDQPCSVDSSVIYRVPGGPSGTIEVIIDWDDCDIFNGTWLLPTTSPDWGGNELFPNVKSSGVSLGIIVARQTTLTTCRRRIDVRYTSNLGGGVNSGYIFEQTDSPGTIDLTQWQTLPFSSKFGGFCTSVTPASISYRIVG